MLFFHSMFRRPHTSVLFFLTAAFSAAIAAAQQSAIDTARSTIAIHAGKAGFLSAAGHDHWIDAPISSGTIRESPRSVEFTVDAAKITVRADPKVSQKDQAQIQKDMDEKTLETTKYPEITFHSTHIEKTGPDQWKVTGSLSLHGVAKPVTLNVTRTGDAYTSHTMLKQTDFGIKPFSAAGGTIKVKNEVQLDFKIFTRGPG